MAEYSSKINILPVFTSVSKNKCFRIYRQGNLNNTRSEHFAEENHSKSIKMISGNTSEFTFGSRIIHSSTPIPQC